MRASRRGLTLLLVLALAAACADRTPTGPAVPESRSARLQSASSPGRVAEPRTLAPRPSTTVGLIGTWGGDHVRITIGAAASVIEYDCARGSIDQPFAVDASGQFDLAGTHVTEQPGPTRETPLPGHPARYAGSTDGKTMTYVVTLTDSNQTLGPFTLSLDAPGRVVKCV